MRFMVAALLAFCMLSAPALGNDIKGTLNDFGLIGPWSADCRKAISEPSTSRVAFVAAPDKNPTATAQDNRGDVLVTTVYDIVDSTLVDSDKIRIALHPLIVTRSGGKATSRHDYDNMQLVFQKVGDRIEVVRVQFEGLPEIERKSVFEKCPQ